MKDQLRLGNQLCFRLYTASRLITQAYHPLLSRLGLTYPQYLVMMVLWEEDGLPVNDIAKRLVLETNTVTPLLKRMEAEGLLRRVKQRPGRRPEAADAVTARAEGKLLPDGRRVLVYLTEKGRTMEEQAACIPFEMGSAIACRSITPETAPALYSTLDDLIRTLQKD